MSVFALSSDWSNDRLASSIEVLPPAATIFGHKHAGTRNDSNDGRTAWAGSLKAPINPCDCCLSCKTDTLDAIIPPTVPDGLPKTKSGTVKEVAA